MCPIRSTEIKPNSLTISRTEPKHNYIQSNLVNQTYLIFDPVNKTSPDLTCSQMLLLNRIQTRPACLQVWTVPFKYMGAFLLAKACQHAGVQKCRQACWSSVNLVLANSDALPLIDLVNSIDQLDLIESHKLTQYTQNTLMREKMSGNDNQIVLASVITFYDKIYLLTYILYFRGINNIYYILYLFQWFGIYYIYYILKLP